VLFEPYPAFGLGTRDGDCVIRTAAMSSLIALTFWIWLARWGAPTSHAVALKASTIAKPYRTSGIVFS